MGEIVSRGPDCCIGYTEPALTRRPSTPTAGTAPATSASSTSDGYLTITDRISDIIIRGGENISAQEIEELLLGMDGVAEVAVVAEPDERLGEHAAAVVACGTGWRHRPSNRSVTTSPPPGWPARSGPSRSTRSANSPGRHPGKVQKFRLRQHAGRAAVGGG